MANQAMTLSDMVNAIGVRVDDVIDLQTATEWLNAGQNQMAIAVGASFPQLSPTQTDGTFVFDAKWQEIPILYACAMFKGKETSLQEKNSFLQQFSIYLKDFQAKYQVPIIYRDDMYTQQFVAVADQTAFEITDPDYSPDTADLKVYVNGKTATFDSADKIFTLYTPCVAGDLITAIWELHVDLQEPPYAFWSW